MFFSPLQDLAIGGMFYHRNNLALEQNKIASEQSAILKRIEQQNRETLRILVAQSREMNRGKNSQKIEQPKHSHPSNPLLGNSIKSPQGAKHEIHHGVCIRCGTIVSKLAHATVCVDDAWLAQNREFHSAWLGKNEAVQQAILKMKRQVEEVQDPWMEMNMNTLKHDIHFGVCIRCGTSEATLRDSSMVCVDDAWIEQNKANHTVWLKNNASVQSALLQMKAMTT